MLGAGLSVGALALRGLPGAAGPALWDYDLTTGTLPPVIAVARATTACRVNASGLVVTEPANTALVDHHPTTLVCIGLRLEPQLTNYQPRSSGTVSTDWALVSATAAAAIVCPDGVSRTNSYAETTANAGHGASAPAINISGASRDIDISAWLKHDAGRDPRLALTDRNGNVRGYTWDGSGNPTLAEAAGGATPRQGVFYQNGWLRCVVRVPIGTGAGTVAQHIRARSAGITTYVGDTSVVLRGFGVMLTEAVDYVPHLIPTTGAAQTRDADVLTLLDTSRAVEITYSPLPGGAAQVVQFSAGAQPTGLPACWVTRVRQL